MQSPSLASNKERLYCLGFSLGIGALFAYGFIPTSQSLFQFFSQWIPRASPPFGELKEMSFFPLLAALFAMSLPKRRAAYLGFPSKRLLTMSLLPILIAFAFGKMIGNRWKWDFEDHLVDTVWYLAFIPLGEECLFRGWLYGILDRLWPEKLFTMTNPLPMAVWGSALAFSVWHIQNLDSSGIGLVVLQIGYTLITGLWLGILRNKTGQLWPGTLAHILINFVAGC